MSLRGTKQSVGMMLNNLNVKYNCTFIEFKYYFINQTDCFVPRNDINL